MKTISLLLVSAMVTVGSYAQDTMERTVMVGGAEMHQSKNIVANAMNSKDHTTLVSAVKAAGLVQTLQGPGPYTVFAPTNEAFGKLPSGSVESMLQPKNKAMLSKALTYHVIDGKWDSMDLAAQIAANGGTASLRTLQGGSLKFTMSGNKIVITDENGGTSSITIKDIYQSNGVTHVVDTVLMPTNDKKQRVNM